MYLDTLQNYNLRENYTEFRNVQKIILNLHSAIIMQNIGIYNGILFNKILVPLEKNVNQLSHLDLVSNIIKINDKEYIPRNEITKHYTDLINLNKNTNNILMDIHNLINKKIIIIKIITYDIKIINNINFIIFKHKKILNKNEITIKYTSYDRRYNVLKNMSYESVLTNILISYDRFNYIIKNRINNIIKINKELLITKTHSYYNLMIFTLRFNNKYKNITNIINSFLNKNTLNDNNFKIIGEFYYNNKIFIESIYNDFKDIFIQYISLF